MAGQPELTTRVIGINENGWILQEEIVVFCGRRVRRRVWARRACGMFWRSAP